MHPVVKTAILLVVLMFMSASAWNPGHMCATNNRYKTMCGHSHYKDWFQMGNRCVKAFYHNKHLTFDEAQNACKKYPNGNLVSIHSLVELCQVECAMWKETHDKSHYWIGLKMMLLHLTRWFWTDGSGDTLHFSYWAAWQPDSFRQEHCTEMNYWEWGYWNNEQCWARRPYVCQLRI